MFKSKSKTKAPSKGLFGRFEKDKKVKKATKAKPKTKVKSKAPANHPATAKKGKTPQGVKTQPQGRKKGKKGSRQKPKKQVAAPYSTAPKMIDKELMRHHNFLMSTGATYAEFYPLTPLKGPKARPGQYEIERKATRVSTCLKLVLNVQQTQDLWWDWSLILWNISQRGILEPDIDITFVRSIERRDNQAVEKAVSRRKVLNLVSSDQENNVKSKHISLYHDRELLDAVGQGDSVVGFSAEVWVTAPDELKLEAAVTAIQDYLKTNDETRGLTYELDINKQNRPLLLYGPNANAGNKDIYTEMTSNDGAVSGLFVDAGGDRTVGAEYLGFSVGKLIQSHAAYNLQHNRSLIVGNDTREGLHFLGHQAPTTDSSRGYLSKLISRSYMLAGRRVVHFVADEDALVSELEAFKIYDYRKSVVDVAKGLLNIIEPIKTARIEQLTPERIAAYLDTHFNNIITLLSQFRDQRRALSVTDEFATVVRKVLYQFFNNKKYWSDNAMKDFHDVRLFVNHADFDTLADFGQYVHTKLKNNDEAKYEDAFHELNAIINQHILPTIPSLNTQTSPEIDRFVDAPYAIVDLSGTGEGAMSTMDNPTMNVMMIAYLNVILPALTNGDVIFIHGLSRMSRIGKVVIDMINSSGLNLDVVFTEKNQNATRRLFQQELDTFDFVMVDLHKNKVEHIADDIGINKEMARQMLNTPGAFYIQSGSGMDYIRLDNVL